MKTKKWLLYSVTICLSIVLWLILSGVLIFSSPRKTTKSTAISENPNPVCAVEGFDDFYTTHYGLPMASYENMSNVCFGDSRQYFSIGITVDAATALVIIGIPAVLMLRHLRKKYAIIASR